MKRFLQAVLFEVGYFLAGLFDWRDRTWLGNAKVFTFSFLVGVSFTARDGRTSFRFAMTWLPTADIAYGLAESNADAGRRYWAILASDDDLDKVFKANNAAFAKKVAGTIGYEDVTNWLDEEYRVVLAEMKHRIRLNRHTSKGVQQAVAATYGKICRAI